MGGTFFSSKMFCLELRLVICFCFGGSASAFSFFFRVLSAVGKFLIKSAACRLSSEGALADPADDSPSEFN